LSAKGYGDSDKMEK